MKNIYSLGPKGTYSEIATKKFIDLLNLNKEYTLKPSIDSVFKEFDNNYLILPFENSIDGYVQRTIDLLHLNEGFIKYVYNLPISFSFISNEKDMNNIKDVYVQFKTKNQVLEFLSNYEHFNLIITESNATSLNDFIKNSKNSAAVIPSHLVTNNYNLVINNIEDVKNNFTKFILINKNEQIPNDLNNLKIFLSLTPNSDKPGLLYNLLGNFKKLNINLSAILSRPRKDILGKYHFYLELDTNKLVYEKLKEVLNKETNLDFKILGAYYELT